MVKLRPILRRLIFAALAASAAAAWAQQTQITARVDRDLISMDETVELTVTVVGSGLSLVTEPDLPNLSGFDIIGTATQQSISLVGGSMQTSMNYVYELQPRRAGKLTIPPIRLSIRGRSYRTEAIAVTVHPGSGRTPGGPMPSFTPDRFDTAPAADVKHTVDDKTAYVGQQITYTFTFMQSDQLYGDVRYAPAETPGFVAEDLPNPPQATQTVNGRIFTVQRRLRALFPTSAGKHTIGEASVVATMDPVLGEEKLVAKPIIVDVLPLPQTGRPAGFGGAVGSFSVRLRLDRPVVRAGETASCVVDVTGTGNISSLGAPQLAVPDWVRVYKAPEQRSASPGGGGGTENTIGGSASFSYLLLPRQAGTLRVGPVAFPYFDPIRRTYRIATSNYVDLTVTPGAGAIAPMAPTDTLRPVKTSLGRPVARPLVASALFWIIVALPALAVAWVGLQRWQEARVLAAPEHARAGRALALALKRFDAAEESLAQGQRDAFYAGLHEALLDYIADRTAAPPSGLTADVAYDLLMAHGADADLAALTRTLIERTAAGRFAPGAADAQRAQQLAVECRQTLAALQRQVRPDA